MRVVVPLLLLTAASACWTPVLELPEGWEPRTEVIPFDAPPTRDVRTSYHDRAQGVVGRRLPVLHYPDGRIVRDGLEEAWYEDGTPRLAQEWDMDRRVGITRRWGPDGTLLLEVDRGDGVTPASMRFWHPNGVLSGEGLGVGGVKIGPWKTWHDNGVQRSEGAYLEGIKEGAWSFWDEFGRLTARGEFKGGQRVGAWELAQPLERVSEDRDQVRQADGDEADGEGARDR